MHDLDRIQAELRDEPFDEQLFYEQGALDDGYELDDFDDLDDEDEFESDDVDLISPSGDNSDESLLDEEEEIDLASELLAATDEEQLERATRRIVRARTRSCRGSRRRRSVDSRRRKRRRGLLGKALKGIAKKALPVVGGAVGSLVAPGVGSAVGAKLASGVGKAFGLELEGLSPEDQEFEVARGIVRLGAAAADETDQIDDSVDDEAAAKAGVIRASRRHAPGVVPRSGRHEKRRPHSRSPRKLRQSGRWVRQGNKIVLQGI